VYFYRSLPQYYIPSVEKSPFRTLLAFYNGYRIPLSSENSSQLYALDQVSLIEPQKVHSWVKSNFSVAQRACQNVAKSTAYLSF
jgi:sortase (surface protein transpeptidase)